MLLLPALETTHTHTHTHTFRTSTAYTYFDTLAHFSYPCCYFLSTRNLAVACTFCCFWWTTWLFLRLAFAPLLFLIGNNIIALFSLPDPHFIHCFVTSTTSGVKLSPTALSALLGSRLGAAAVPRAHQACARRAAIRGGAAVAASDIADDHATARHCFCPSSLVMCERPQDCTFDWSPSDTAV